MIHTFPVIANSRIIEYHERNKLQLRQNQLLQLALRSRDLIHFELSKGNVE